MIPVSGQPKRLRNNWGSWVRIPSDSRRWATFPSCPPSIILSKFSFSGYLMDIIRPVLNEPALILEQSPSKRYVMIADLHLAIEHMLIEKGVQIPLQTQTNRLINKLMRIVKSVKPTGLIILGDIKHNIPMISHLEWQIIPTFFGKFSNMPIHVLVGNHESIPQMEGLTTRNVIIHPAQGCLISLGKNNEYTKVGLFHGHTWPGRELFNADVLIMAHNHPVIEFKDELNIRTYEPVWIRAHWNKSNLINAYLKYYKIKKVKNPLEILRNKFQMDINDDSEIIIMPAFNDLLGGIPFNVRESRFIGPLLKSNSINIEEAEAILLDGTLLGKIKEIQVE